MGQRYGEVGKLLVEGAIAVKQVSKVFNHSQILVMKTSPLELVPKTETLDYSSPPTKLPTPVRATIGFSRRSTTPYSGIDAVDYVTSRPNFMLCWGADFSVACARAIRRSGVGGAEDDVRSLLTGATALKEFLNCAMDEDGAWGESDFLDNGLYLTLNNNGTPAGGHANDTVWTIVDYVDVPLFL